MRIGLVVILICAHLGTLAQSSGFTASSKNGFSAPVAPSTELGLFGGVSYYTGELNRGGHFNTAFLAPAFGIVIRQNLNGRYTLRFSGLYGSLSGDDSKSPNLLQQQRNLNFKSPVAEGSAIVEFNFFNYCPYNEDFYFVPFVFAGVGGFWFSPSTLSGDKIDSGVLEHASSVSNIQPSVPFGAGIKIKSNRVLLLSVEWGLRKTFTDYIDDVSTRYYDTQIQRGNSKNNDWYSYAGVVLSIRIAGGPPVCLNPTNKK